MQNSRLRSVSILAIMAVTIGSGVIASAQDTAAAQPKAKTSSAVDAFRDEIVVTATKKADAENVQDVPLAVTAFGANQLEALHVSDLQDLTTSIPNVSFDDIGTSPGIANFSIRGLGINSSIPSIDPTVGVFVDGMYLGINAGVVVDMFDLESIEVLRGPQGILFGRNTTGGAVLINTKAAPDQFEASMKVAVESGLRGTGENYFAMGSIGGPIVEDKLNAKLSVYYNDDKGWFENDPGGQDLESNLAQIGGTLAFLQGLGFPIAQNTPEGLVDVGKSKTVIFRPSLTFTPTNNTELKVRYEHGEVTGDGPPIQVHPGANGIVNPFFSASRESFGLSINNTGSVDNAWENLIAEGRLDLGDAGVFTAISGWRKYTSEASSDIDGTPYLLFNGEFTIEQEQISHELRYNKEISDRMDLTLGAYYFDQDIAYDEDRTIFGGYVFLNGGGIQSQQTVGFFGQTDIALSDSLTVNLGARYTEEEKSATISNLLLNTTPCDISTPGSCSDDFADAEKWNNFTPKIGLNWEPDQNLNVYANWTKGVRSGGYNFRNSSLAFNPGPFGEEKVDAYEVGVKTTTLENKVTLNAALFLNEVKDMQREINLADPVAGVVQLIRNTADASIWGFEAEAKAFVTDHLILTGNVGYLNGSYKNIVFDLTGDGVIDAADEALEIPRLAPWSFGVGAIHSFDLSESIVMNSRINYSHRDKAYYTDNNLGFMNPVDMLDGSIALDFGKTVVSLYAKNLLNDVNHGGDTQLPATFGYGSGGALTKGRNFGIEIRYDFK